MDTYSFCEKMVLRSNLEMLQWGHEKGFPWNKDILASSGDNLNRKDEIIKYLIDHGCPLDESSILSLLEMKKFLLVECLIKCGCPHNLQVEKILEEKWEKTCFSYCVKWKGNSTNSWLTPVLIDLFGGQYHRLRRVFEKESGF